MTFRVFRLIRPETVCGRWRILTSTRRMMQSQVGEQSSLRAVRGVMGILRVSLLLLTRLREGYIWSRLQRGRGVRGYVLSGMELVWGTDSFAACQSGSCTLTLMTKQGGSEKWMFHPHRVRNMGSKTVDPVPSEVWNTRKRESLWILPSVTCDDAILLAGKRVAAERFGGKFTIRKASCKTNGEKRGWIHDEMYRSTILGLEPRTFTTGK